MDNVFRDAAEVFSAAFIAVIQCGFITFCCVLNGKMYY